MALDTELIYLKLHRVDCKLISTCRNHCTYNAFMASVEHTLCSPRTAIRGVSDGKVCFCNFIANM